MDTTCLVLLLRAVQVEDEEVMVEVAAAVDNKVWSSMVLMFLTQLVISVQTNTANLATTVVIMSI